MKTDFETFKYYKTGNKNNRKKRGIFYGKYYDDLNLIVFTYSICHKKDNFDRDIGLSIVKEKSDKIYKDIKKNSFQNFNLIDKGAINVSGYGNVYFVSKSKISSSVKNQFKTFLKDTISFNRYIFSKRIVIDYNFS